MGRAPNNNVHRPHVEPPARNIVLVQPDGTAVQDEAQRLWCCDCSGARAIHPHAMLPFTGIRCQPCSTLLGSHRDLYSTPNPAAATAALHRWSLMLHPQRQSLQREPSTSHAAGAQAAPSTCTGHRCSSQSPQSFQQGQTSFTSNMAEGQVPAKARLFFLQLCPGHRGDLPLSYKRRLALQQLPQLSCRTSAQHVPPKGSQRLQPPPLCTPEQCARWPGG